MIKSYRHVGIVVKNMNLAIDFYCDNLNHKVIVDFIEKGAYFNRLIGMQDAEARVVKVSSPDGTYLELIEFINCPVSHAEEQFNVIGCNHICFTVDNIDDLYLKLLSQGIEFISPPLASDFDPVKTCFCYDPDRTLIQFVEITDSESILEGLR